MSTSTKPKVEQAGESCGNASESGQTRTGGGAGTVGMEQFSELLEKLRRKLVARTKTAASAGGAA
jgi:hypothetical protein